MDRARRRRPHHRLLRVGPGGDAPPVDRRRRHLVRVVRLRLPFPPGNPGPGARRRFHVSADGDRGGALRRPRRCRLGAARGHGHVLRDPRHRRAPPRPAPGFLPTHQLFRFGRGGGCLARRHPGSSDLVPRRSPRPGPAAQSGGLWRGDSGGAFRGAGLSPRARPGRRQRHRHRRDAGRRSPRRPRRRAREGRRPRPGPPPRRRAPSRRAW